MICSQCPRRCAALRTTERAGGVCAMPALPVAARAALHLWEEPCISGSRGAGTVFFSGCNLGCVYCQNEPISHGGRGVPLTPERLRGIFLSLIAQGAHNLDLVTPTHFTHALARALGPPLPVPVVWNSSAYELPETLETLEGKVQIYLPDLKYPDAEGAGRYSAAADYPEAARAAIAEMVRQTGPCVLEDGLLKRGVLIRHLLLPGRLSQAREVMDWVAAAFPPGTVLFSLMSQYTPPKGIAARFPELGRSLRASERRAAGEYMRRLGLEGYVQSAESVGEGYIPSFDLTGLDG
ncbi:hypothetical protein SDC9_151031 [bioreactor metagenome]|uniref:Radical SAM core domain-containing protein n=1 Tax=bioreactor metagenome TaxID=1076179 RepID=A0A645EPP9_9ZZZZ